MNSVRVQRKLEAAKKKREGKPVLAFVGKNRPYSNFYPVRVTFEDVEYPTIEHAYVAAKTLNPTLREKILKIPADSAGQVKRLGRQFKLREDWEEIKFSVMENLLRQKFSQEPFREMLLSTEDAEIVEGNTWHDQIWGVCNCVMHGGRGENNLGRLIVQIRGELRKSVA